jgi:predicted transcriptional regulator of viral defense system
MRKSSFEKAKDEIINTFDLSSESIYSYKDLESLFKSNRNKWKIAKSSTLSSFISFLQNNNILKKITIKYTWITFTKFIYREPSIFKLVHKLKKNAYLTHYSAMYIHNLTEQIPKSVYLNFEQPPKPKPNNALKQESIDNALKKNARITKSVAVYGDFRIYLINGKHTNKLGVINTSIKSNEIISVTNLERTLIDIAVRPAYSGGIYEVLKAYEEAAEEVSINKLTAILKKMDYIYPYHQVIGFYLEKSGKYRESQINLLKEIPINHKFYLVHGMKKMDFSETWQLFFPKDF